MNCWELLGIQPTSDRQRVEQAYQQQLKFASSDEALRLEQAYREATGAAPMAADNPAITPPEKQTPQAHEPGQELDAYSAQVIREVVIQIKALLNDSVRADNAGVWKAILSEPPADQTVLRVEIGRQLEPQLRPLAENGVFPAPVVAFLGDWFAWPSLQHIATSHLQEQKSDARNYPEQKTMEQQGGPDQQAPQSINFWPAVIGWIVGLAILTSLFGGMGGG